MRAIIATIFLLSFSMQTFQRGFIVADYYINTGSYLQNCENKAKPKLKCHGKCQMMRKLAKSEKQEQEHPESKADNKNEVVFSESFPQQYNVSLPVVLIEYNIHTTSFPASEVYFPIFHPPAF